MSRYAQGSDGAELAAKLVVGIVLAIVLGVVGHTVPVDWLTWPVAFIIGMVTPWVCVWGVMLMLEVFGGGD